MWTGQFWKEATERAVKSALQGLILVWGVADGTFSLFDVKPLEALGLAGGAMLLSYATSIVTSGVGQRNSPSAVSITPAPPAPVEWQER